MHQLPTIVLDCQKPGARFQKRTDPPKQLTDHPKNPYRPIVVGMLKLHYKICHVWIHIHFPTSLYLGVPHKSCPEFLSSLVMTNQFLNQSVLYSTLFPYIVYGHKWSIRHESVSMLNILILSHFTFFVGLRVPILVEVLHLK